MIEKIEVEKSVGMPLLHDVTGIKNDGFKGAIFKRGHIIKEEDIEVLKDLGKNHIYIGELGEDYVHEEDAASILAPNLINEHITLSRPNEGKINLIANYDGMLFINEKALFDINSLSDYTIATKKQFFSAKKGDSLAGVRIVPLWTKKDIVSKGLEIAKKISPYLIYFPIKN